MHPNHKILDLTPFVSPGLLVSLVLPLFAMATESSVELQQFGRAIDRIVTDPTALVTRFTLLGNETFASLQKQSSLNLGHCVNYLRDSKNDRAHKMVAIYAVSKLSPREYALFVREGCELFRKDLIDADLLSKIVMPNGDIADGYIVGYQDQQIQDVLGSVIADRTLPEIIRSAAKSIVSGDAYRVYQAQQRAVSRIEPTK